MVQNGRIFLHPIQPEVLCLLWHPKELCFLLIADSVVHLGGVIKELHCIASPSIEDIFSHKRVRKEGTMGLFRDFGVVVF